MKNQSADSVKTAASTTLDPQKLRPSKTQINRGFRSILPVAIALLTILLPAAVAQQGVTIEGTVHTFDGKPANDAIVSLQKNDSPATTTTKTNAAGKFAFSSLSIGTYQLSAEKSGLRSGTITIVAPENGVEKANLALKAAGSSPDAGHSSAPVAQAMEFSDQPNFTVAGVTDWTAVGGHGSDSTLRTSESLASETLTLESESAGRGTENAKEDTSAEKELESNLRATLAGAPNSFDATHRLGKLYLRAKRYAEAIPLLESAYRIDPANGENQYDLVLAYEGSGDLSKARERIREILATQQSANLHRLMGELDEKLGDPLSAVHEYEQAVKLSPNEQNYFVWGSELLLHRAVWQAQEVFHKGAEAYPKSARMQTALGTALFAGARYDEAALRLCDASDLNPADPNPYIFMGKIQMAAPNTLACVKTKLARFVQQEPGSSIANYLYAMSILKDREQSSDEQVLRQAEAMLLKAVAIDSKCSAAYLQLGIISASQRDFDKAIGFYTKAIEADPQLADAHYRLGVAYDRTSQPAKAKREFQLHDQVKQQQTEVAERQRREVKQFLIIQPGEPASVK